MDRIWNAYVAEAQRIYDGGTANSPSGGFLMALTDKQQEAMYEVVMAWAPGKKGVRSSGPAYDMFHRAASRISDLHRSWSPKGQAPHYD